MKGKELALLAQNENDLPEIVSQLLDFADGRKKFTLSGDLGAGKTALVKAFCKRMGVDENVSSPTFSIVNQYSFKNETDDQAIIHHMDLYRLRNVEEALDIGIEDYLYDEHFCFIEWPEIIEELLPPEVIHIKITILPNSNRKILFLSA